MRAPTASAGHWRTSASLIRTAAPSRAPDPGHEVEEGLPRRHPAGAAASAGAFGSIPGGVQHGAQGQAEIVVGQGAGIGMREANRHPRGAAG